MKYFKKAITIFINVLVFLVVIAAVFIMVNVMNNKIPSIAGYSMIRVVSGSMEPSIHIGDYLLIKKTDPEKLENGDIITFYSPDPAILGKPNTHYIVDINGDVITTKGKANSEVDEYKVSKQAVIGKMVTKLDFMKFIEPIINNKLIFMLVIIVPLCIMIFFEVKSLTDKKENKDEDS
ncbi:MAG: signal peptidase I [Clostridia bacterium]